MVQCKVVEPRTVVRYTVASDMAELREFRALRRRLHNLREMIADIERNMTPGSIEASVGSTTVYLLNQYNEEADEIDFILRWHQRVTNGALSRMQWMLIGTSLAVSSALLVMLILERFL